MNDTCSVLIVMCPPGGKKSGTTLMKSFKRNVKHFVPLVASFQAFQKEALKFPSLQQRNKLEPVIVMEEVVVIVRAGPFSLVVAACLSHLAIPYLIIEREDCSASLWKKRTYNRLKLYLAKEFCSLPFVPHPPTNPTFLSKDAFIQYLDDYVLHFNIKPNYFCSIISSSYDET